MSNEMFSMRSQNGGVQEAALLRARAVDDAEQEESDRAERQSLPEEGRLYRAQGHEQRLTIAGDLERADS